MVDTIPEQQFEITESSLGGETITVAIYPLGEGMKEGFGKEEFRVDDGTTPKMSNTKMTSGKGFAVWIR